MKNKQDTIRISALSLMLTLAAAGATFTMGEFDAYASTILKVNRSSLAAAQTPAVAQPSANAHWESSDGYNWKYRRADGSYATGWVRDEATNDWYYMDAQGNMKTGLISDGGYSYLLSNQHDGRYGHMIRNGESFNGHTIKAWTAGSGNPEGALMGDAENDRAIKDSGNYYVYNTASGTLTYNDNIATQSYQINAGQAGTRVADNTPSSNNDEGRIGDIRDVPPADVSVDGVDENSETMKILRESQRRDASRDWGDFNPLNSKVVIH